MNRRKRNRDFWQKSVKNEDLLEDLGVKEIIMLKYIFRK